MKDIYIDTLIVAAKPNSDPKTTFVISTMEKIMNMPKAHHSFKRPIPAIASWFMHLSKPAMALIALITLALAAGVVYALVQFAPALLHITGKTTTSRGTSEYTVAGLEACRNNSIPATDKFEVNSSLKPISDEEFTKIVQAKCELDWINGFINAEWPPYGTNPEWKDGEAIFYTRTDVMGEVQKLDTTTLTMSYGASTKDYKTFENKPLLAYKAGAEVPISSIKVGDTVFSIVRATQTYYDRTQPLVNKQQHIIYEAEESNPRVLGLVAIFKLSLAKTYYTSKQAYLIEVPACLGNTNEYCPNTPSIDVYPRQGGEGATNPYFKTGKGTVQRQISGKITKLTEDTATITSRTGNVYEVTVGDAGFAAYNQLYAANYTSLDARLKVGSNINVYYTQSPNADPKKITKDQVQTVILLLESLNPKTGPVKQY